MSSSKTLFLIDINALHVSTTFDYVGAFKTSKYKHHIVDFREYFTYDEGHSKGTPVAFSNLFRAELLYQRGGLYADLDMFCLKPY